MSATAMSYCPGHKTLHQSRSKDKQRRRTSVLCFCVREHVLNDARIESLGSEVEHLLEEPVCFAQVVVEEEVGLREESARGWR